MHGQIHFDCYQDWILNISTLSLNNGVNFKNPSKVSVIIFFQQDRVNGPCQGTVPLDLGILICTSKTGPTLKDDVLRLLYWASMCAFLMSFESNYLHLLMSPLYIRQMV